MGIHLFKRKSRKAFRGLQPESDCRHSLGEGTRSDEFLKHSLESNFMPLFFG